MNIIGGIILGAPQAIFLKIAGEAIGVDSY